MGSRIEYKVQLHVDSSVKPVVKSSRSVQFHSRKRLVKKLCKMEESGIMEEHTGPALCLSNVVLTPKDDGGVKVTVDIRNVNKAG